MINYWYQVVNYDSGRWGVEIMANSDALRILQDYDSKEEAEAAGKAFIEGVKFARGE